MGFSGLPQPVVRFGTRSLEKGVYLLRISALCGKIPVDSLEWSGWDAHHGKEDPGAGSRRGLCQRAGLLSAGAGPRLSGNESGGLRQDLLQRAGDQALLRHCLLLRQGGGGLVHLPPLWGAALLQAPGGGASDLCPLPGRRRQERPECQPDAGGVSEPAGVRGGPHPAGAAGSPADGRVLCRVLSVPVLPSRL